MAESKTFFCSAEFRRFDPVGDSAEPSLRLFLKLGFTSRQDLGNSAWVNVPDGSALTKATTAFIQYVEASLYWRSVAGSTAGDLLLSTGRLVPNGGSPLSIELDSRFVNQTNIMFPLSARLLSKIEERRAGGDASFGVSLLVTGVARGASDVVPNRAVVMTEPFGVGNINVELPEGGGNKLVIAKSDWVDRFLPALQHGTWKTVEFPLVPIPNLGPIDEQIETAARHFRMGEWRSSVESSRLAIQECRTHLMTAISPVFKDRKWAANPKPADAKVSEALDALGEVSDKMEAFQTKLVGLLSSSTHVKDEGTLWERPDAEFSLELALAMRRYVGLRFARVPDAATPK
jgi:hypothetical protein